MPESKAEPITFESFDKTITECACCMNDIIPENYALYRDRADGEWKSCKYCLECITRMINVGWQDYVKQVREADCARALRRLIEKGPPINVRDPTGIECDNDTQEVHSFYFNNANQSAKLTDSLTGKERETWWKELQDIQKGMAESENH